MTRRPAPPDPGRPGFVSQTGADTPRRRHFMTLVRKKLMFQQTAAAAGGGSTLLRITRRARNAHLRALGLLATPNAAPAGAAPAAARFTRFSVERGLSQSTVQAVLQDRSRFLWFGTGEGLNRYDGYRFVVFKHDSQDPKSLPSDRVTALYEDRQGRLWVGTEAGLSLFDHRTETFTTVPNIR